MKLSNLSVKLKLFSIVLLAFALIVVACAYNLIQQRNTSMAEREIS